MPGDAPDGDREQEEDERDAEDDRIPYERRRRACEQVEGERPRQRPTRPSPRRRFRRRPEAKAGWNAAHSKASGSRAGRARAASPHYRAAGKVRTGPSRSRRSRGAPGFRASRSGSPDRTRLSSLELEAARRAELRRRRNVQGKPQSGRRSPRATAPSSRRFATRSLDGSSFSARRATSTRGSLAPLLRLWSSRQSLKPYPDRRRPRPTRYSTSIPQGRWLTLPFPRRRSSCPDGISCGEYLLRYRDHVGRRWRGRRRGIFVRIVRTMIGGRIVPVDVEA